MDFKLNEEELFKWNAKSNFINIFKIISTGNDIITFKFINQVFTIYTNPKINIKYDELDYHFKFLKNINKYITKRNPKLSELLLKIEDKYSQSSKKLKFLDNMDLININVDNIDNINHSETNKELEKIENKKKLNNLILVHYSLDQKTACEHLINERLKCNIDNIKINIKDLFNWSIKMKINNINIKFNIEFNEQYPYYPPAITNQEPYLLNNINQRIAHLKMLQFKYWTPTRSINYILERIKSILNNLELNIYNLTPNIKKLDNILINLKKLDVDNIKDDNLDRTEYEIFLKKPDKNIKKITKNNFKKGTGFSCSNSKGWDINKYLEIQKIKNIQIIDNLEKVLSLLYTDEDYLNYLLEDTILINFINDKIHNVSIIDITKYNQTYILIFNILKKLIKYECLITENLFNNIKKLNNKVIEYSKFSELTKVLESILYVYQNLKDNFNKEIIEETDNNYKNKLSKYKFDSCLFNKSKFDHSLINNSKKTIKRIASEYTTLMDSLEINECSSILIRTHEQNINLSRALITGPEDTPYEDGIFLFDILFPENYPKIPPKVLMNNTGNCRFNPNLYNCGKVCLSILGTWQGSKGEEWNGSISNLNQVLLSIQSLILVDEPYFNEPGYQSSIGTDAGIEKSKNYNIQIRLYTIKFGINYILQNLDNYTEFKDFIIEHFKFKKNKIINNVDKWLSDISNTHTLYKSYIEAQTEMKILLNFL